MYAIFVYVITNTNLINNSTIVLGICIGCIVAKTNILVCGVGTNVPKCG